jgi:putative FmdB family regulatory protein
MPIYEYRCSDCGRRFTEFSRKVLAREEDVQPPCPNCLSTQTTRQLGSFITQGAKPANSSEAGYSSEQNEREMQMTPKEHIEEYRKVANSDPK